MIDKIIIDYLKSHKRLVVPDFGAFIHKEESGSVVFVPFLRKDDGILEEQVSAVYGLSRPEAKTAIEEFVRQVKAALAQNGVFVIERLGLLQVDANGIYYLDYNPGQTADALKKAVPEGAGMPSGAQFRSRPQTAPASRPVQAAPVDSRERMSAEGAPRPGQPSAGQNTRSAQAVAASRPVSARVPAQGSSAGRPSFSREQPTPQPPALGYERNAAARPVGASASRPERENARPRPRGGQQYVRPKQKRADLVMVIAIIAALVAIGAIVFGYLVTRGDTHKIELIPQTEQVAEPASDQSAEPAALPAE